MAKSYSFDGIIASPGFYVYRQTTWSNAKAGDKEKVEIENNL